MGAALLAAAGVAALLVAFPSGTAAPSTTQAGALSSRAVADGRSVAPGTPSAARPTPRGVVRSSSLPVRLEIAAIDVHSGLLHLGLNPDGTLQVPWKPLMAGWFSSSPTPGTPGPSVIAGHVDSAQTGPAVFYRLGQLAPRDRVRVVLADGRRTVFSVYAVREYPKAHFPTVPVYGNTDGAELRLITCGDWDETRQEYVGNVVVYARLVETLDGV